MYAGSVQLFAEASEFVRHVVFQLSSSAKRRSRSASYRAPKRLNSGGDKSVPSGCMRNWFVVLFGRTFRIHCFNFLNFCTYRSGSIVAPLFKNPANKTPSVTRNTVAMTLPSENCTSNLFCLIPELASPTSVFFWLAEVCCPRVPFCGR
jgi:hypothetical protein